MGIDYGRGLTNIDLETGIRYGIISGNLIDTGDFTHHYIVMCPECCSELEDTPEESDEGQCTCPKCGHITGDPDDFTPDEPSEIYYKEDGYEMSYSADSNVVWVFKSPVKTMGSHCSPCAPGAVSLTGGEGDAWGYCLEEDWFYNKEDMPYEATAVKVVIK